MKYYLIAGEASGDLHASNLMRALMEHDAEAQFRFVGGDLMRAVGGSCVKHYNELAYMGFVPVLLHARTILANMRRCKRDIERWQPHALILVDYPGFNLSVAKYIHSHTRIPVFYYISPKIWAWKEYRIKNIRRDVDELFSILPFEVPYFDERHYPAHYVGNPVVDAVAAFCERHSAGRTRLLADNGLSDDGRPIVALLAGSRRQEIEGNLPKMLAAMQSFPGYRPVIAGAPGIDPGFYRRAVPCAADVPILFGQTYPLLQSAHAALVTSGTATLEAALFDVPQVVCYHTPMPRLYATLRRWFLKVKYVSLVNLIAGRGVVAELVADTMTVENVQRELEPLLPRSSPARLKMLDGYARMRRILGGAGASQNAARQMVQLLCSKYKREG